MYCLLGILNPHRCEAMAMDGSLENEVGWVRRCHEARDVIVTHALSHSHRAVTD